ncbi:MAG: GMP synthase [Candidatus Methanosuratus sp.]|nr:GMP synthase [Candidatus Methanosuratincola sp.]
MRRFVGEGKAAIATSGGVDSTVCAALAHRALGDKLVCFFLDTGFMREGEAKEVGGILTSLGLPLRVLQVSDRFMEGLKGKADAESKRIAFRQTFYTVLGEAARAEGCDVLIQGTIAPDWIETAGGIKTQHNVLEQLGVDTRSAFGFRLLEPLLDLYKDQVRRLAVFLGVDLPVAQRQPFPGPGLMVRCIGEVTREKMDLLRKATRIVEGELSKLSPPPKQYFAAVAEDDRRGADERIARSAVGASGKAWYLGARATGVKGDERAYGRMVVVDPGTLSDPAELFWVTDKVIHEDWGVVRVLLSVKERDHGGYAVIVRSVETRDFMTAKPTPVPRAVLERVASSVMEDERVGLVCYDLTSKPPATVEFE